MARGACKCDIENYLPIAMRPNPEYVLSSSYDISACPKCGRFLEGRPDYEVEDRHGSGPTISFEVDLQYVFKYYVGIYFDLLAEMINIRESLGYKDNVENIDAALKDKVDLNMVPPVELRNFSHHPLEVTEKAWEEYRARIKVEKKKT